MAGFSIPSQTYVLERYAIPPQVARWLMLTHEKAPGVNRGRDL